ncbi:hypothetical protein [Terasakiella sp. SH-1]|uniref:peptidoglycan-binding domain-containing protein n=1 Tax=Terasakiella sp. SH-1 TaxID=2560057 RepID=UPI00107411B4|nr:hypothetical protein [Terasakiella sp. SH-1]
MSFSDMFKGFKDFFTVDNPVSSTSFGMSNDVVKTQNALGELGHLNEYTPDIGEGLKSFQAEQGLQVDGLMNPGGETENALSQTLASQGIGNTDLLAKSDSPLPSNVTVTKPTSSKPDQKSWTASASFGEPKNPRPTPKAKIDPITGLVDPLAQAPKGKMPTAKQWEEVAKLQKQKAKTAIVPEGKTVQQRISSMMFDPRYQDKNDTRLRDHVVKQFEKAYPGTLQFDETGKMVQPQSVIKPEQVEPYDPNGELKIQEQSHDQGQTDYVQGIPNELPQRDQTTSANANQTGRVDYPQAANVRSATAKSSDQLASDIPLNADALKDAKGYGLEQAEQSNSYQVTQVSQTGVMSDAQNNNPSHDLGHGGRDKVIETYEYLKDLQATDSEAYSKLPDHVKNANEKYWYVMRSTDPEFAGLDAKQKLERALRISNAEAALSEYPLKFKRDHIKTVTKVAKGLSGIVGDKKSMEEADHKRNELLDNNKISPNYEGEMPPDIESKIIGDVPILGHAATASDEYLKAVKAGVPEWLAKTQGVAVALSGDIGKKALKYLSDAAQNKLGKSLKELTSDEVNLLIQQGTPKAAQEGVKQVFDYIGKQLKD